MPDPRFQSVHIESKQRREAFRQARARMEADCGKRTIAGEMALLAPEEAGDGPTVTLGHELGSSFWIQDGDVMHELSLGVNSIGRLPDNTIVVRDECVSRRHCAIVVHSNGICEVHELASKNGTLVNGKKISKPTVLRSGDQIGLCARKLLFMARRSSSASPSPSPDPKPGSSAG